ncbi:MAG: T9SS type A sorting domain-containing protein [Bacteroidetes bacterium]|nr:T9SS type A sorting domain-containing protein [Bacteroidota bacterium]MCZ2132518.1 T9SS type A sorting domain-containing protein [Bacteroidota bacterium]MCZ2132649.1 T9SS type A sorting domain-containing protein [Bacteroidota bacterium]MCZ2132653.1 T9SS type A sorting domain-containing protein [Bacteroidota bacterium]
MQDGGLYRSTERFPPVGVSEQPAMPDDASLQIIPNPAGESFRVAYSGGGTVTVRDVLGRVVLSGAAGDMFSTAGLAAGAYSVEVYPDNKSKRLSAIMMLRR